MCPAIRTLRVRCPEWLVSRRVQMPYKKVFEVANPSSYERSGYIEVDLNALDVPVSLGRNDLRLIRVSPPPATEVAYQIDYTLGEERGRRIMTFPCAAI